MRFLIASLAFLCFTAVTDAQIEVGLKFKRLQFVAHEPVIAIVGITNHSGRAIDFQDEKDQPWFGFELTAGDGRLLAPAASTMAQPGLHLEAGQTVTRKINLTSLFPVYDLGAYHIRANVYFANLNRFFSSPTKVFQVADGRLVWQKTVGVPEENAAAGEPRTYSLLSYRFPDHTSIYVRVENRDRGVVYTTCSLGRVIAYDQPETVIDRKNQLHVLHCAAPRKWAYSQIGINGEILRHSMFMETKTRPRLRQIGDGKVAVKGGQQEVSLVQSDGGAVRELSEQPTNPLTED